MKVLFVCSSHISRSPTAESQFKDQKDWEVKSAGVLPESDVVVSKELLDWADRVFVMEQWHKDEILRLFPSSKEKIVVLNIPDLYAKGDPTLIKVLRVKMRQYL